MRRRFTVSLEIPEGASTHDVACYIYDAVATYHGSLHPPGGEGPDDVGDPLFYLDNSSIMVTYGRRKERIRIQ